jgi:hypothetical protein
MNREARLDQASDGLGSASLVRAVALRLADQAVELQQERQRSLFAGA